MLIWNDNCSIGMDLIDTQHKHLFEIGNQAYALLKQGQQSDKYHEINLIIEDLQNYTKYHFKCEEEYMIEINYPEYEEQKKEHNDFIKELEKIKLDNVDNNQQKHVEDLLHFIFTWILDHIIEKDRLIMKANFKSITTERLLIRKLEIVDREDFFKYRSLPQVYEYQSFIPKSLSDVDDFISRIHSIPNIPNTWFQLAILKKDAGVIIGDIGIHFLEDGDQVEIGYTLAPTYQGKGYAIEALKAVISYLFFDLEKHRITASVDPNNSKSIKLLEKLGMRKEGHFIKSFRMDDRWLDDCIYAILREEWK